MAVQTIEPLGIPEVIQRHGWIIWCWTGWKGTKTAALSNSRKSCSLCSNGIREGDIIEAAQGLEPRHWRCVYPDNQRDRHMGQWLAARNGRYLEVNVDNLQASYITGIEYRSGESFPVSTEGEFITEDTPYALKEIAKLEGLKKMHALIEEMECQTA